MDLESIAGELYALHPTQFVKARTVRTNEALTAGRAVLAAQIGALRRPTLSGWASNLLVQWKPDQVTRLLRLGEGLRQARHTLDRAKLKRLNRQQHALVDALSRQARDLAAAAGHPIGEAAQRKAEETLHAALADPEAARVWASGRLVKALVPPVGFTAAAADAPAGPAAAPHKASGRTTPPRSAGTGQRAPRLKEEHDQAQAAVERATAALRELEERVTELARQLHATVELRRRVRNDLADARKRVVESDRAAQQARSRHR
ncbi:hypothetical protein BIV24_28005 [Streptomyces colonosanans]|uniref:Uncharacterized protein n=2 Tax=Streptomyces colonosanans TaxID=1428652 RepID=A0A1S2NW99_9ACTN|nr:hypothetical protein BIV24_28005 [Streptomyces colonosanans]